MCQVCACKIIGLIMIMLAVEFSGHCSISVHLYASEIIAIKVLILSDNRNNIKLFDMHIQCELCTHFISVTETVTASSAQTLEESWRRLRSADHTAKLTPALLQPPQKPQKTRVTPPTLSCAQEHQQEQAAEVRSQCRHKSTPTFADIKRSGNTQRMGSMARLQQPTAARQRIPDSTAQIGPAIPSQPTTTHIPVATTFATSTAAVAVAVAAHPFPTEHSELQEELNAQVAELSDNITHLKSGPQPQP